MRLIEITDDYINYMMEDFSSTMLSNKEESRVFGRKYLGVILHINGFDYFAPLSSPKTSDYHPDGSIRASSRIVLRMIKDYASNPQLLGTIKLNNMLPVPQIAIVEYDLNAESNTKYKSLVEDEWDWIQQNTTKIINAAKLVYNLKNNEQTNINEGNAKFYLSIMPFDKAEEKSKNFSL